MNTDILLIAMAIIGIIFIATKVTAKGPLPLSKKELGHTYTAITVDEEIWSVRLREEENPSQEIEALIKEHDDSIVANGKYTVVAEGNEFLLKPCEN